MKSLSIKKTGALLLSLLLMIALLPSAAFATDTSGGSASTSVTYESSPSYTVRIPDSVEVGEEGSIELIKNTTGKSIRVSVDANSCLDSNGYLTLYNSEKSTELKCVIDSGGTKINQKNSTLVEWSGLDNKITKGYAGFEVQLYNGEPDQPGTYNGTLQFKIESF